MMIIAYDDRMRLKSSNEKVLDIFICRLFRELLCKWHNHQVVNIGFSKQFDLFFLCVDQLKGFIWIDDLSRVRIKTDDDRFTICTRCFFFQSINDLLMSLVNSIKSANSDHCIPECWKVFNCAMNLHNGRKSKPQADSCKQV